MKILSSNKLIYNKAFEVSEGWFDRVWKQTMINHHKSKGAVIGNIREFSINGIIFYVYRGCYNPDLIEIRQGKFSGELIFRFKI